MHQFLIDLGQTLSRAVGWIGTQINSLVWNILYGWDITWILVLTLIALLTALWALRTR